MSGLELLEQVRSQGVEVYSLGDRFRLRPAYRLTPELIETLRAHKAEVLEALRAEQQAGLERVEPWQPPGGTTDRCPSCGGGLQPNDADGAPCFTCQWPGDARVQ